MGVSIHPKINGLHLAKKCLLTCESVPIQIILHMHKVSPWYLLFIHTLCTPQPLYNTIVGVHSINRVSQTTVLYPNKNVWIILKNDHLWSFFNIIYTFWDPSLNCVISKTVL